METVARTPIGEGIGIVVGCRQLTSRLKHQNPVVKPGFVLVLVYKSVGLMGKIAHSKKAFPIGKAFKLVAERTGLEPATPGVTGRYS
ncbi:hypothetical protein, partial [Aeromonas veronii]|uniref:hypothetical protein n=1 Tax=Aeromonas veronii TaxID=654 RepID=UPI003BA0918B